jgi:ABC-2 type transport system permease protein
MMINIKNLWKQRFVQNSNETRKYLRYMLNDHLLFVLLFALGGAAYYYKNWVTSLPDDFPYIFILAIVLSLVLTHSPIRTFLKEADIAFLLQIELKLADYFKRSIMYSSMMQTYWIIIAFVGLLPIYSRFTHNGFSTILLSLILFVTIKFWNLKLKWNFQYYTD